MKKVSVIPKVMEDMATAADTEVATVVDMEVATVVDMEEDMEVMVEEVEVSLLFVVHVEEVLPSVVVVAG